VLFIAVYVIATIVSALEAEVPAGPAVHDHPVKHVVAMLAARLIVAK